VELRIYLKHPLSSNYYTLKTPDLAEPSKIDKMDDMTTIGEIVIFFLIQEKLSLYLIFDKWGYLGGEGYQGGLKDFCPISFV
jgi:hypothetical protein